MDIKEMREQMGIRAFYSTAFLFVFVAISNNALSQSLDNRCGLYLHEARVCMEAASGRKCAELNEEQSKSAKEFRCLVRDLDQLKDCEIVYLSFNTRLGFLPFRVRYQGLWVPGRSVNSDFYDEEKIKSSCVKRN